LHARDSTGRQIALNVLHDGAQTNRTRTNEVRRQAEHRIRRAASLARPGWIWAAAVIMNAPSVAGAALLAWFAYTADGPALTTVAGVLFVLALFWALIVTADSWQVLRRFARRFRQGPKQSLG
jgi:hypothetical protein